MPRTLKRRSDAISRDESPEVAAGSSRSRQSQQQRSPSLGSSSTSDEESQTHDPDTQFSGGATQNNGANVQLLTKKLIRLALSSEYARIPLRRADVSQKIFKESNASPRLFRQVFAAAQKQLESIFGMRLVELPSKEKTSLKDRRTQQQQASSSTGGGAGGSNSNKSWILVSILPHAYKTNPVLSQPSLASSQDTEATYTAMYTFILSLIYLNNSSLPESKLDRYLKRVNAETMTPFGAIEKLIARMIKEGYIERRRELLSGEEVIEYAPGPRGKVEVGVKGVAGLVRSVYGHGAVAITEDNDRDQQNANVGGEDGEDDDGGEENENPTTQRRRIVKIDKDDLESRLKRSLGLEVLDPHSQQQRPNINDGNENDMAVDDPTSTTTTVQQQQQPGRSRRSTRRRNDDNDDDDDDDE